MVEDVRKNILNVNVLKDIRVNFVRLSARKYDQGKDDDEWSFIHQHTEKERKRDRMDSMTCSEYHSYSIFQTKIWCLTISTTVTIENVCITLWTFDMQSFFWHECWGRRWRFERDFLKIEFLIFFIGIVICLREKNEEYLSSKLPSQIFTFDMRTRRRTTNRHHN